MHDASVVMQFTFHGQSVPVNMPDLATLRAEVARRFAAREGFSLATVNLDHLARMTASEDFARTYAAQDLIVADGRPVGWLSRLSGRPVEVLPGSDLVLPLCNWAAQAGLGVALVGSTPTALDDAARALAERVDGLDIRLKISPPLGLDPTGEVAGDILGQVEVADVGLCLLALGAEVQENVALRGRALAPRTGFACFGAGLDFLGGHQVRAPRWMRRLGLEWLWRMLGAPRRMVPRYARCLAILPRQTLMALRQRRG